MSDSDSVLASGADSDYLNPSFFLCKTKHVRFRPKQHSFQYSYLVMGFPVTFNGRVNRIISIGKARPFSILSICQQDYLLRMDLPLAEKLDIFLNQNGLRIEDYPYIYLVTAPRFLGHAFNPISFWYLYDDMKTLMIIVLEVSNTFGEKQIYILERPGANADTIHSQKFKSGFQKLMFVSPFNDHKGSYRIETTDPLHTVSEGALELNVQISLLDDTGQLVLHASLRSVAPAIRADKLLFAQAVAFAIRHGWIILLTEWRTLLKAANLFFIKRLPLFSRPCVVSSTLSISRTASWYEKVCEGLFIGLLNQNVLAKKTPLSRIEYYMTSAHAAPLSIRHPNSYSNEGNRLLIKSPHLFTLWIATCHDLDLWRNVLSWAMEEEYLETTISAASLATITSPANMELGRELNTAECSWYMKFIISTLRSQVAGEIRRQFGDDHGEIRKCDPFNNSWTTLLNVEMHEMHPIGSVWQISAIARALIHLNFKFYPWSSISCTVLVAAAFILPTVIAGRKLFS